MICSVQEELRFCWNHPELVSGIQGAYHFPEQNLIWHFQSSFEA